MRILTTTAMALLAGSAAIAQPGAVTPPLLNSSVTQDSGSAPVSGRSFAPAASRLGDTNGNRSLPSVDAFLKKQMYVRHIPGMQVAIVRHRAVVWLHNYGLSSIQHHAPVRPESVFSINSATKAFTGVAILQLQEMGKIALDDGIERYLNDIPAAWGHLTVRQLLTHTAGLPDMLDASGELRGNGREQAAWEEVTRLPLVSEPGDEFDYNQTGYMLLGRIISRLTGQSFTDFIAERQFKPAHMTVTRFADSADVIENSAGAYMRTQAAADGAAPPDGWVVEFDRFPIFLRPAGGIVSTAEDLARWVVALQSGVLLKRAVSLRELWAPVILNNGGLGGFNVAGLNGYALGWSAIVRERHPAVAADGGARAAVFVYPQDDFAIVVLTNMQGSKPEEFMETLASLYMRDSGTRWLNSPTSEEHRR